MERSDLGEMFARVTQRLIALERPLLTEHELAMWDYVVLSHLAREPAGTQLALAEGIGYDKTRLIALLDRLEGDGLITRKPDPADRRARNVHLTAKGRKLHAKAQASIRAMEDEVLADLSDAERRVLLEVLPRLSP